MPTIGGSSLKVHERVERPTVLEELQADQTLAARGLGFGANRGQQHAIRTTDRIADFP
jgi:hypothetical protein